MGKKKGKRKDEFVNDIPVAERTREFEGLLESLGPDGLKERIATSPRDVLDKWVAELAGRAPHDSQPDDFVRASLGRGIDGDANWGDDPKRMEKTNGNGGAPPPAPTDGTTEETTHTQGEAPEGEEVMTPKNGNGKKATEKTGKKATTKKMAPPPRPEKVKKEKKGPKVFVKPDGTIMTRPWGERNAWFVKVFKANKVAKHSIDSIMKKAEKEFGKENVGRGAWTPDRLVTALTEHAKKGMYGLSKEDLPFVFGK